MCKLNQNFLLRKILACFIFASLASISSLATASTTYCENIFSSGVQAYGEDSYIRFDYNAQVLNASSSVNASKVINNKWSIKKSCASSPCDNSGWVTYNMAPIPVVETQATNEVNIAADKKGVVGLNDVLQYGKITVAERAIATFKQQHTPYVISDLVVGYKSKLRLPAGEYWISRLKLEVEGSIEVIGVGQVTLYVIDSLWVPFNFKINENTKNPLKLAIYTLSDSNFCTGSSTYGFVRSEGEVVLNHRARIVGGVLGKYVNLQTESQVVYDPAAVKAVEFKNYCSSSPYPLDVDAPVVVINQFDDYTEASHTLVTGTIIDSGEYASGLGETSININGAWVPLPLTGNTFSIVLPLPKPDNLFTILAYDLAGNEAFIPFVALRIFPE